MTIMDILILAHTKFKTEITDVFSISLFYNSLNNKGIYSNFDFFEDED